MKRRLILGAAYLLIVVVVAIAVPFGVTLSQRLTDELGGRVEREGYAVAAAVEDRLERGQRDGLDSLARSVVQRIGGRVIITDGGGILLADSQGPVPSPPPSYASRPEIALALAGSAGWSVRSSRTLGHDLLVSAVPVSSSAGVLGTVRISFPMDDVREAIWRAWGFLALVGGIALVAGLAMAAGMARWVTRPLASAASMAGRIGGGDLDARVPEEGPPEVRELARDMNSMAQRISDMLRAEREFAANASHQLRTPLAALRLSLEEVAEGSNPRREAAHAIAQADRLGDVVNVLLRLGEARERGRAPVDLVIVARELSTSAADGPAVDVEGAGLALGDPERIRQVVGNLLDNARRYARDRVEVVVRHVDGKVTLRVDDDGPGIPEDERARVFDRFYRGRTPRGRGSGLGLALARELARADGGTIHADGNERGGARFDVTWDASPDPDG